MNLPIDEDIEDAEDGAQWWEIGQCDRCRMAPGEVIENGDLRITCMCAIGQGAASEDCVCGPESEDA